MASAVASAWRASPIDVILRAPSTPLSERELERYSEIRKEHRLPSPLPPSSVFRPELSRASSTSSQSSSSLLLNESQYHNRSASLSVVNEHHRTSLPAISSITASLAATPPQIRSFSSSHASTPFQSSIGATFTPGIAGSAPPVCQNCSTSTTPLWRRDESGSVLCNACGLFLKLHGRPRPISLKTDVIKSRNRVKSTQQGPRKKFENGLPATQSAEMITPQNHRVSQMVNSGASDRSHSPISRTGTPGLHHDPNIAPQHMFDGVSLADQAFGGSPSLPPLNLGQPSPNNPEASSSYEQLMAVNANLRMRVSELEVINMVYSDNENSLRNDRDNALLERDNLKRKVEDLENQLRSTADFAHPTKKQRMDEETEPDTNTNNE